MNLTQNELSELASIKQRIGTGPRRQNRESASPKIAGWWDIPWLMMEHGLYAH
jgi:hypothetical protein